MTDTNIPTGINDGPASTTDRSEAAHDQCSKLAVVSSQVELITFEDYKIILDRKI